MQANLTERTGRTPAAASRRATAHADGRSAVGAGELAAAARRANTGPHAARLAALAPQVGGRPCPGCEAARRGMEARAQAPVQRVVLGDQGQLDTQNPADFNGVLGEILSMDWHSLLAVRGMLDPGNREDRFWMEVIDYELEKAGVLADIDQRGRDVGGLYTTASVFVDGQLIARTEPQTHPANGQRHYARMQPGPKGSSPEVDEDRISHNDSEVGTLEDAWEELDTYLQQVADPRPRRVRILLAGTSGPCDGCKRRIEAFRDDVLQLLPPGSLLWIESAYLNASSVVPRAGKFTRYGFENETADRTAARLRYRGRSLPLAYS